MTVKSKFSPLAVIGALCGVAGFVLVVLGLIGSFIGDMDNLASHDESVNDAGHLIDDGLPLLGVMVVCIIVLLLKRAARREPAPDDRLPPASVIERD